MIEADPVLVSYRAVVADEVQDFSPSDLRLLRALVPDGRTTCSSSGMLTSGSTGTRRA